jgi:GTPase SAR1 family protein
LQIDRLPLDAVLKILSFLDDPRDLCAIESTCRRLRHLAVSDVVWAPMHHRRFAHHAHPASTLTHGFKRAFVLCSRQQRRTAKRTRGLSRVLLDGALNLFQSAVSTNSAQQQANVAVATSSSSQSSMQSDGLADATVGAVAPTTELFQCSFQPPHEDTASQMSVVLMGSLRCGKSSVFARFCGAPFDPHEPTTLGARFATRTVGGRALCRVSVWDTSGQHRYRNLLQSYYKEADVAALLFDSTDAESFGVVHELVRDVCGNAASRLLIALVACKTDLPGNVVTDAMMLDLIVEVVREFPEHRVVTFACSALADNGASVHELFANLAQAHAQNVERMQMTRQAETAAALHVAPGAL